MRVPQLAAVAFVSLFGVAPSAHAVPVLLTSAYETQLETWLGQGNLNFANIFTKDAANPAADDSIDFHTAADGKGATFTLMQAVFQGQTYVVGGYNPQSWSSADGTHVTIPDSQRTAFIYNLTTGAKQSQRLSTDPSSGFYGEGQTYNSSFYGPTFGDGFDLTVEGTLNFGTTLQWSYGTPTTTCGLWGVNIFGASYYNPTCSATNGSDAYEYSIGALEVYTFAAAPAVDAAVPEPATLTMLGLGLAGAAARRFRRKQ